MLSELENYRQRLDHLRSQVRELVSGLPPEALNWRPLPTEGQDPTNSLAVLTAHVAGAEHFWIAEVIGGRPPTRDRDAEFTTQAVDSQELLALLDRTAAETGEVIVALPPSGLNEERQAPGRGPVPVRWCLMHVATHSALHLGHMQLTYQLWTGGKSKPSPFWHEILKEGEGE